MNKLYVLVRKDMKPQYQAVQAGHAVAEYLLKCPQVVWDNGTLVYLGVKNQFQLKRWATKLKDNYIFCAEFREPDMNNEVTAIATVTNDHKIFKSLQLL